MMGKGSSLHERQSLLQPDLYQGSSCLICSLVARYAKGMLDNRPGSSIGSRSSSGISSLLVSASLLDGKFNIERRGLSDLGKPPPRPTIERTPSMTHMPPPPPRFGSCPTSTTSTTTNSILRQSSFTTLDDNTDFIVLPDSGVGNLHNNNKDRSRLRAGSYDERQSRRVKFAPGIAMNMLQQTADKYDDPQNIRPRSASCSNSSSSSSSSSSSEGSCGNNNNTTNACGDGICEAIVEEEEGYVEQPMFSMDL